MLECDEKHSWFSNFKIWHKKFDTSDYIKEHFVGKIYVLKIYLLKFYKRVDLKNATLLLLDKSDARRVLSANKWFIIHEGRFFCSIIFSRHSTLESIVPLFKSPNKNMFFLSSSFSLLSLQDTFLKPALSVFHSSGVRDESMVG